MEQLIRQLLEGLVREAIPHVVKIAAQQLTQGNGVGGLTSQPQNSGFGAAAQQTAPQAAPQDAFGGFQQTAPVQQNVTPEMIQKLITPLLYNEAAKGALTQQMQGMGINGLHEARPDQLGELYQRFQQVAQQYSGNQAQAGVTQQAAQQAAPSII